MYIASELGTGCATPFASIYFSSMTMLAPTYLARVNLRPLTYTRSSSRAARTSLAVRVTSKVLGNVPEFVIVAVWVDSATPSRTILSGIPSSLESEVTADSVFMSI
ncbi:hypothetical protein D3C75_716810 [compost metagenome]